MCLRAWALNPEPRALQVNVPERKLILSERAAMLGDLLASLSPGDVVEGVVTRLTDFGAFVSLVGADGKMHGTEVRRRDAPRGGRARGGPGAGRPFAQAAALQNAM